MPIFHINNKKVLFVHIPKNYGTFIENLLSKFSTTMYACRIYKVLDKNERNRSPKILSVKFAIGVLVKLWYTIT